MGEPSSLEAGCAHLDEARHACAFFRSEDEAYEVLMPFIREGLHAGDKVIHVGQPDLLERKLRESAVRDESTDVVHNGVQIDSRRSADVYLRHGHLDVDQMLAAFEAMASGREAHVRSRIVCDMGWATIAPINIQDLMTFESRVNDVWARHNDCVICFYDVRRLSGDIVIDIVRTHPLVLIGETLHKNPFYVPPAEFLAARVDDGHRSGRPR